MAENNQFTIYTDGSCLGNPGPGGWGAIVFDGSEEPQRLSGHDGQTTNNRMELMGAIMALESLKERQRVVLTTDSQYVINGSEKGWAKKWRANGWRRKTGRALNPDLWERLLQAVDRHDVSFKWVRGHRGHPENERCDELANGAARGGDLIVDELFVEAGG